MDENAEEYVSCKYLQGGLNFQNKFISTCNFITKGLVFYDLTKINGKANISFNKIEEMRKENIEKKAIPKNCEGCFALEKKVWNVNGKINKIELDHWRNCNCGCIYCSNRGHDQVKFLTSKVEKSQFYDVLPILKKMKKKNLFDDDIVISTTGGEPASLEEYPQILELFLDRKFKEISILSSGIKYLPIIEKALSQPNCYLTVSLDCGTKETYKRIKMTDAFDKCVNNLKNYAKHSYAKNSVILKYIVLPNINDNKEEIDKFFDVVKEIGSDSVSFSLEFCHGLRTKQGEKIPQKIYDSFDYAQKKADEYQMNFIVLDIVKDILQKGHY